MRLLPLALMFFAVHLSAAEFQKVDLPGGHMLSVPADWSAEGGRGMRAAQFTIPGEGEQRADFVIYYFGPDGAGPVQDNLGRWKGQFQDDDRTVEEDQGEGQHGQWHLLALTGTWNKPIGPPMAGKTEPAPGSAMLAAILPGPEGPYYLKLTGPEALVLAQREAVEQMLTPK